MLPHCPAFFRYNHVHRTGDLRLRPPQPTRPYVGTHYVQAFGKSCPQQALTLPNVGDGQLMKDVSKIVDKLYEGITPSDEDCKQYIIFFIATS